ncbi:MAG: hypothetical protein ABEJ59_02885 [Halanaeroarchaeum sp.]
MPDVGGDGRSRGRGPVLYLDEGEFGDEQFCTAVFEGGGGGYRVVQLSATQSFEAVRDSLSGQLEAIDDPSEAAVIITTPHPDEGVSTATVGEKTPLFGFRVDSQDLTGISVAFSRLIQRWEQTSGRCESVFAMSSPSCRTTTRTCSTGS